MVKRTFSSPLTPLFCYLLPLTHFIVSHHWFRNTVIKACPRVCDLDQVVVGSEWRKKKKKKKKKKEKIRDKNPKMGRGKIEIKMIENATNRQVTFSKRRSGLLKKAEELSVLCDAQVLLVMATPNNKAFNYCTPGTNIKSMVDRYQGSARVDLWEGPYKEMQQQLSDQMKINNDLRKEIRQRRGEELCDMDMMELHRLDEDLYETANMVREKIKKKLDVQENTRKKKVRSLREANRNLEAQLRYMEMQNYSCYVGHAPEDNQYNIAALSLSNGDVYDAAEAMEEYKAAAAVGLTPDVVGHGSLAFRLQPNQPNLHYMGYGLRDLRLA